MPDFTGSYGKSGTKSSSAGKFSGSFGKKTAKKKRGDRWWNAPGKVADVLVDDVKTIARGIPAEAVRTAKVATAIASPYSSNKARAKGLKEAGKMGKEYVAAVDAIVPDPSDDENYFEFVEAWKNRPVTSFLTGVGVVAPLAGTASVSRIAGSLRAANRTMSKAESFKIARRESRNPGYAAAQGIKGGLKPRTLKSEIEGGQTREVEFPQGRSAIGRAGQGAIDRASKKLPKGSPLSERRRSNREIAREMDETDRANTAHAANLMHDVRKVAFGPVAKSRRGNQSLLAYALQTPKGADPFQGPKAVAKKFDEILKAGGFDVDGGWRALNPTERKRLTQERARIRKALANPPDVDDFARAVDALEQVADESTNISKYITQGKAQGVSPDEAARLNKIFDDRRGLLSTYLGIQGEARGFFPHRESFDLKEAFSGGARGAGPVIGRPKSSVNMNRNELKLFRSGKADTDPRILEQQYAANMRFLETEKRRREMFDEAVPLERLTGKEKGGYLIRDPDRAAAKLTSAQKAMHNPKQQAMDLLEKGDGEGALAAWREEWLSPYHSDEIPAEWADAPEAVRWVPKDVVDKRLPRRVSVDPQATGRPLLGTLNAIARVATIQGKPARYLTTNTIQNLVNATITSPTVAVRGAANQAGLLRAVPKVDKMWKALRLPDGLRRRRPDLYHRMSALTGDAQATAGLPTLRASDNVAQKTERGATLFQRKLGDALGSVADTPYRNAMGLKHAKRLGFKSDAQLERLLTSDEPQIVRARRQVMQSTRDDMYDFNRLSVWERETISRFFFLWPLVRAGIRWPVTYTRDYPMRAGVGAALTMDDELVEDTEARDLFKIPMKGGEYDTAWGMPHGISVDQLENLQRVLSGDFRALGYMFSPPLGEAGQALFGFDRPPGERLDRIARSTVPGYAGVQDVRKEGVKGLPVVKRFTPQKPR
jgi:hypothetical protein